MVRFNLNKFGKLIHTLADSCKGPDADVPGRERGALYVQDTAVLGGDRGQGVA